MISYQKLKAHLSQLEFDGFNHHDNQMSTLDHSGCLFIQAAKTVEINKLPFTHMCSEHLCQNGRLIPLLSSPYRLTNSFIQVILLLWAPYEVS